MKLSFSWDRTKLHLRQGNYYNIWAAGTLMVQKQNDPTRFWISAVLHSVEKHSANLAAYNLITSHKAFTTWL